LAQRGRPAPPSPSCVGLSVGQGHCGIKQQEFTGRLALGLDPIA
jgi:hypothetical protein